MYLFFKMYIFVYCLNTQWIIFFKKNNFKWQFISFKALDMYPATLADVSICIRGQSGATDEYKSSIFNEVFSVFKLTQHVEIKITTCSMHMNIICISSSVKDAYVFKDKFPAAVSHSEPSTSTVLC